VTLSDKVHCFSWSTGVSFELPRSYERVAEDESSALYAAIGPDDVWPVADTKVSRIKVRVMGAPADASRAAREQAADALADGFAGLEGEVLRRERRSVDGVPVATVVIAAPDGGWLHLTAAVTADRLLSVAGTTYDEAQLASFDEAVASARFIGPTDDDAAAEDGWASVTALDLRLSMRVPVGWEGVPESTRMLRFYGGAEDDAHRPTLSIEQGEPEEPGPDWFSWFTVAMMEPLAEETPGYELLDSDRYGLSSGIADVYVVAFRRTPDAGPATSQLLAYVWAGDQRMYVLSASTPREREDEDLTTFELVLRSLRLLPAPRTS
jgi:hypothetical protein